MEQTLVIVKPDGYERGFVGEIIGRFERAGLRLAQIRISVGESSIVERHYPTDDTWFFTVGSTTLADYANRGLSVRDEIGIDDPVEIGKMIRTWLSDYLMSGRIIPMVIEGNRAVSVVRKIVGATVPADAVPGTIRGDFATDSPDLATAEKRPIRNLIHASGDITEARREINLWFG